MHDFSQTFGAKSHDVHYTQNNFYSFMQYLDICIKQDGIHRRK